MSKKTTDFPQIYTIVNGSYIDISEINTPLPGFTSNKILFEDFILAVQQSLNLNWGVHEYGKNPGDYTQNFSAKNHLIRITCSWINTNQPSIRIGTTLHGEEILPLTPIDSVEKSLTVNLEKSFIIDGTIYYEVFDAPVDIVFNYIPRHLNLI